MTFPAKVFVSFLAAFALAAVLLFSAAITGERRTFSALESSQVAAAFENVKRELDRGSEDVVRRVNLVAESEATLRMALDLSRPQPDYSIYANDASGAARTHALEIFEFVSADGTIISSTEPTGASGRKEDWVAAAAEANEGRSFLRRGTSAGELSISQLASRTISIGGQKMYAVGGRRLDHRLLAAIPLGPGMRTLLYVDANGNCDPQQMIDSTGASASPGSAAEFLAQVCRNPAAGGRGQKFGDRVAHEDDFAMPLTAADHSVLGAVVIGYSSAAHQAEDEILWRRLWLALLIGIVAGALVSYWSSARLVKPLVRLARSAKEIALLTPGARAEERGGPEVVALAQALNQAAQKLAAERERLLQAERIASWREMTRRLTADIESALEALGEARAAGDASEGVAAFQRVLDRYREFGEMLVLPVQSLRLNDVVRAVLRDLEPLFNPSVHDVTRPPISPEVALAEELPAIRGDSSALGRALDTFLLYAVYSMPTGGTFVVRTGHVPGFVSLRIEWPGRFPNEEEAVRLFSAEPIKRAYLSALELPAAHAIITDHGGTVETIRGEQTSALVLRFPEEVSAPAATAPEREPTAIPGPAPASPLT